MLLKQIILSLCSHWSQSFTCKSLTICADFAGCCCKNSSWNYRSKPSCLPQHGTTGHPLTWKNHVEISLTHWGPVTHICVGKLITIGSENGLAPSRHQAIIWTNAGLLSIGTLPTYFCEILIKIQQLSLKKMHLKMSSAKPRLCCLSPKILKTLTGKNCSSHTVALGTLHSWSATHVEGQLNDISITIQIQLEINFAVIPFTAVNGPFYKHGLTLIPACISNYIHYKVWDEITYPFLNFNGATVEV